MKTATEILTDMDIYFDVVSERARWYYKDLIKDAMENYSEQCSIYFAEWIDQNCWIRSSNDMWYHKSDGNIGDGISTEELYFRFKDTL